MTRRPPSRVVTRSWTVPSLSSASGVVRPSPGAHFAERPSRGLRAAAAAGRAWRFLGRRSAEARAVVIIAAAGFVLLACIDLTRPDVPPPYEMHVDNGYETEATP